MTFYNCQKVNYNISPVTYLYVCHTVKYNISLVTYLYVCHTVKYNISPVTNVWQQVVIVYWITIHMYFISLDQYDDIYTKKIKYSLESVNA